MPFWRRHLSTLVLAVLAVVAVVAYLVLDQGRVSSREAKRREGQLLPAWRKADLERVTLEHGGATLRLERGADAGELDYRMLEPVADEIDAVAVDHLLTALELAPVVRKLDAAPEQFGEVLVRVSLSMGKVQYAFEVGGEAATPSGAHYLRLTRADGASDVLGIYVVPAELVSDLTEPVQSYRSKQVVPYLSIALDALEIRRGAAVTRLERTDPVSFHFAESKHRVSRKRLDVVWAALAETRLESFAASPEEEAALLAATEPPQVVVVLRPDEGPAAELHYGGPCPGHPDRIVVLRTQPSRLLGCVPKEAADGFALDDLADRGLFALFQDEIAELSATRGEVSFDLAREAGGFRRRSPEPKLLGKDEQISLDAALGFLFVENATLAPAQPSFEASAKLRVVGGHGAPGGGELVEEVELGRCDGTVPCAKRQSDGAVLLIPAAAWFRLVPTLDWTRSADLGLPTERATKLDLDCGTHQQLVRDDAGYRYELPVNLAVDAGRALELADFLRRFRTAGFVAPNPEIERELGHCRLGIDAVTLELGWDAARTHVLGRVRGQKELWLADEDMRTFVQRIYVQRTFWNREEPIEAATLTQGSLRQAVAPEALTGFRADDVVQLGAAPGVVSATIEARGKSGSKHLWVAGEHVRFEGVDATFSVKPETLAPLLLAPDAGP